MVVNIYFGEREHVHVQKWREGQRDWGRESQAEPPPQHEPMRESHHPETMT